MEEHSLTIRIPKEVYIKLKMRLLTQDKSFTQWLKEQVEKELASE